MQPLEEAIQNLKSTVIKEWDLVISQLRKTHEALITFDKDLAREVTAKEKRVNALELKVDSDCENIIALFNPVAIDLRFVLAVLKINTNLERTGDIADGIAKLIISAENRLDEKLLEMTRVIVMYEEANEMLEDVFRAFEKEDTKLARSVFKRDDLLDDINMKANDVIAEYIRSNPDKIEQGLNILSTIRKLERVGDQCKNIAEEIIFYIEAKVLKHLSSRRRRSEPKEEEGQE